MKTVSQMTLKEAQDVFEQMQYMLQVAYPKDVADKLLSNMCEAFFKTYSLERAKCPTIAREYKDVPGRPRKNRALIHIMEVRR